MQCAGCSVHDAVCRVQVAGCRLQGAVCLSMGVERYNAGRSSKDSESSLSTRKRSLSEALPV